MIRDKEVKQLQNELHGRIEELGKNHGEKLRAHRDVLFKHSVWQGRETDELEILKRQIGMAKKVSNITIALLSLSLALNVVLFIIK